MKIAILGAGFTGLTAAYKLSKQGYKITVFEKEAKVGGLASGFKQENWEWSLDYHYHHLFTSDDSAINLLKEIGAEKDLIFKRPKTKIYYKQQTTSNKQQVDNSQPVTRNLQPNNIYSFDSPLDLLLFPHLSLLDKLRTGIILAYLKFNPYGFSLEKFTAYEWLKKYMGDRAFRVLWEPLFTGKFGEEAKKISMAWFWARIFKRSPSLIYVRGGFQNFADGLAEEIKLYGGNIFLNTQIVNIQNNKKIIINYTSHNRRAELVSTSNLKREGMNQVQNVNTTDSFDKVICTLPTSVFLGITSNLPAEYAEQLRNIQHLDCLNLILVLKEKFFSDDTYWLNINDVKIPFLAIVEHTNFMDNKYYGGNHLVYIGNYLPKGHEFFEKSKEELLSLFDPYLKKFNPEYKKSMINSYLFHGFEAQPIIPVNYSKIKPDFATPIPNLYLANMDMVYPWDRGTNYAVELGEKIASKISNF